MRKIANIIRNALHRDLLPRLSRIRDKPSTVHISITNRCNLRCRMCDIWKIPKGEELSTGEWKKIISSLKEWLGPFSLKIAGGEPLVRKDIPELIKFAHGQGIFVGMSTNGTLIDEDTARRLIEAGLDEIHISFDSTEAETHNFLRNDPSAYEQVINGISRLKRWKEYFRSGITINLASVMNCKNIDETKELVEFVEKNSLHSINFQPLYQNFGSEYDPKWYEKSELWPREHERTEQAINYLIGRRKESFVVGNRAAQLEAMKNYFRNPTSQANIKCKAGTKDIAFDPYGNMLLCFGLPSIGNATRESLNKIWKGEAASQRRKDISACRRNCNLLNCNFEE
ncbi:radical SAM protein [Candidatus Woesearchaeota archaeon]|nr:radical SAM protein [Candidatus Woesearchaeota archaeon]